VKVTEAMAPWIAHTNASSLLMRGATGLLNYATGKSWMCTRKCWPLPHVSHVMCDFTDL
jgi:hypothetical protein